MLHFFSTLSHLMVESPGWVFVIFSYCLVVGVKSWCGGAMPLWWFVLAPIVFTGFFLLTLFQLIDVLPSRLFVMSFNYIAGIGLGYWHATRHLATYNRVEKSLSFSPNRGIIFIVLLVFGVQCYITSQLFLHQKITGELSYDIGLLTFQALSIGQFVGALVLHIRRYCSESSGIEA